MSLELHRKNIQYSETDRRLAVKRWKCTERDCLHSLCLRGQDIGGQGSQMKQIKGEPWPPGETLAGHRDGIQMGDHGRDIQETVLLFSLSVSLFFCLSLSLCLKSPKRAASVGYPMSVTEVSR